MIGDAKHWRRALRKVCRLAELADYRRIRDNIYVARFVERAS